MVLLAAVFGVLMHHVLGITLGLWVGAMMIWEYEMYTHGQWDVSTRRATSVDADI